MVGSTYVGARGVGYDGFLKFRLSPAALLVILALWAPRAVRGEPSSSLSWSRLPGGESCIGAQELARHIEERLGRGALVAPSRADLSIEGRVGPRTGGGWRAAIALARADGTLLRERTLETREPSCRALDNAAVLVIALLIDPDGTQTPAPEPEPRVVIREVVHEIKISVHEPWQLGIRSGAEAELGALPGIGWAASLAITIDPPGIPPVELGSFVTREAHADASLDGRSARMRLAGARAAVCPRRALARFHAALCASGDLAWLTWTGSGFEESRGGTVLVPALGLTGRLELPIASVLGVFAGVGVRVPLRHIELTYELSPAVSGDPTPRTEVLFRPAPATLAAELGVMIFF